VGYIGPSVSLLVFVIMFVLFCIIHISR